MNEDETIDDRNPTRTDGEKQNDTSGSDNLSRGDKVYRVVKTVCLVQLFITLGLEGAVVGPTLIDLSHLTGCNYEELSRTLSAKFAGLIIGSNIGGALTDRFVRQRDGLIGVYLLFMAAGLASVPWMPGLWELALAFFIQGLSHGAISATSNVMIVKLWGEVAAPMQLIHLGYGLGTMAAPLIAEPFLSHQNQTSNTTIHYPDTKSDFLVDITKGNTTEHPLLYVPYSIVLGGWAIYVAITFILLNCCPRVVFLGSEPEGNRTKLRDILSLRSCTGRQTGGGAISLVLIYIIYICLVGKDLAIGTFLFTIAVESKLHFSKTLASYWNTAFFAAYSLGRLLASAASYKVSPSALLFVYSVGTVAVLMAISFVGLKSVVLFWILSLLFNLFSGPMFPGGISWISQHMEVKGMTLAIIDSGTGTAGIIVPWLSGYLYQYHSAADVIYLSLGCSVFLLFTLIIAQIYMKYNRRDNSQDGATSNEEEQSVDERTPLIN